MSFQEGDFDVDDFEVASTASTDGRAHGVSKVRK